MVFQYSSKILGFISCQELCGKGGVLFLAQAILKLKVSTPFLESSTVVAAVSRLKAKVLLIVSCSKYQALLALKSSAGLYFADLC